MISDISSTLKQTEGSQGRSGNVTNNTGTLAKLINEIKLIENLSLIKVQGSETLNFQGRSAQLIHAISGQQPFTLINTNAPVDVSDLKKAQLDKTNAQQATLVTTKNTLPSQTDQSGAAPQVNRTGNLVLASRVLNLTVISTPIPTNTAISTAQSNAVQSDLTKGKNSQISAPNKMLPTNGTANHSQALTNSPLINTPQTDSSQISRTQTTTNSTLPNSATPNTAQLSSTSLNAKPSHTPVVNNQTSNATLNPSIQSTSSQSASIQNNAASISSTIEPRNTAQSNSPQTPLAKNSPMAAQPNTSQNTNQPNAVTQSNTATNSTQTQTISSQTPTTGSSTINNSSTAPPNAYPLNQASSTPSQLRNSPTQPSNTSYLVTVTDGKNEFPILSQAELKRGDVVRVLVDADNNMQALPPKSAPITMSLQAEALKQSLPKQLSFDDMSQLVRQLSTINQSSTSPLPTQTQQALTQLMQAIPNIGTLTQSPEAMKQALQTSGTFAESLLLQGSKTQLPEDLKLNLAKLKEAQDNIAAPRLATIPTEQIANAIERITTSQLRHFSDAGQITAPTYPLHIELPIRDGMTHSLVQVEINKDNDPKEGKQQDRRWLVKLKFDFEETGKFEARTSIQANKVSIIFVAEEKDTLQRLQKNMPTLRQQLTNKEIEVERLDTFQAKLAKEDKNSLTQAKPLIDVRT